MSVGLDQEEDTDCVDLSKVTAEEVFFPFTDHVDQKPTKTVTNTIAKTPAKPIQEESKQ